MILIDMNMPQSCQECPAFATKACDKWDKHKTFSDQRTKRHKDCPLHESDVIEVLQEIRQEIDSRMESIIGKYDSSVPTRNMPSAKIERNEGREECLGIIDKHLEQYEDKAYQKGLEDGRNRYSVMAVKADHQRILRRG